MVGTTIGKYRVIAQLGRGASGVVFKAVDPTLNREVAIKVLRPDAADEEMLRRFRTEAAILARLNHPEIATIYELVQTETDLVMVMEFVAGESLEALAARSGRLPVDAAAYLIDRVLSALEHAHRVGIVHRDLKPANVMVTNVGGVKVMDFGIARVCAGERITLHGSMMGTPGYMAPEQILGHAVDARADVYAVGAMLYRLLAGVLPFAGESAVAIIQRQLSDPIAPLRTYCPDLAEPYGEIVARAMAKAPEERFATADEFREALGRVSGTLKSIDLAKRFAQELQIASAALPTAGAAAPAVAAQPRPGTVRLPHRRSAWRWAATFGMVAAVAISGVLVGRRSSLNEIPRAAPPPMNAAPPAATRTAAGADTQPASDPAAASAAATPASSAPIPPASGAAGSSSDGTAASVASPASPSAAAAPPTIATAPSAAITPPPLNVSAIRVPPSSGSGEPRRSAPATSASAGGKPESAPPAPAPAPPASATPPAATIRLKPDAASVFPSPAPPAAAAAAPSTADAAPAPVHAAPLNERPDADVSRPVQVFDAKFLALVDEKLEELDARLVLADHALTLTSADDSSHQLQTLAYDKVTAISYSIARDPLWKSPRGAAPVARRGGALRLFGISVPRHWIALRTQANTFVVLRVEQTAAPAVLASLQERTGLHPQRLTDEIRRPKD